MTRKTSRKRQQRRNRRNKLRQLSGGLESLESRQLLAAVTVGNALDVVDGDTTSISALQADPGSDGISLREAIVAANNTSGADEISFDAGVFAVPSLIRLSHTDGQLAISDDLTINGPSAELVITGDASGDDALVGGSNITDVFTNANTGDNVRVFDITAGTTNLHNLTITGGVSSESSPAVDDGGGIRVAGSSVTLNVTGSNLAGNRALSLGAFGGAVSNAGTATFIDSVVSGNRADAAGGGIHNSAGDNLILINSVVADNRSETSGGGINNFGQATLFNVTLSDNSAIDYGGGFNNSHSDIANLTNVTLAGNEAAQGGGLSNFGMATFTNSTLSGNSASTGSGGIFNNTTTTVAMRNSILLGNDAAADPEHAGSLALSGRNIVGTDIFDGSTDVGDTSAVDVFAVTHTVGSAQAGTLVDNGGMVSTIALRPATPNPALDVGDSSLLVEGAIDLNGDGDTDDTVDVDARGFFREVVFSNGTSLLDLGAFEQQGIVVDTNTDISDGDFSTGQLSLREAIEIANMFSGPDTITFSPTFFTGGSNSLIRLTNAGTLTLSGDVMIDASHATDVVITGDVDGDDTTLAGSSITDVSASDTSDNIRVFNVTNGTVSFRRLTVTGGAVSGSDDGGAFLVSYGATLDIDDSVIAGNSASDFGGAINNFGTVDLNNATLSGNVAGDGGGAINNSTNDTLVVRNTLVTGNSSGSRGGGIVNYGTTSIYNSEITSNTAFSAGGGIHNSTDDVLTMEGVMIHTNTVSGTTAGEGGGVSNLGSVTMSNVTIADNYAAGVGGGLTNRNSADLTSVTVSGNSSSRAGGINNGAGASLDLLNITLSGNASFSEGGAIHNAGEASLVNSTLSGNSASATGGGIYTANGGTTALQTTIVLGNNASSGAETGGTGTVATDSIVGGGDSVTQLVFANTQSTVGVLSGVLADNGGAVETIALRNGTNNPALDISNLLPFGVSADAAGQTRAMDVAGVTNGGVVDAGAYELQNGAPVSPALSLVVTTVDDGPNSPFDGQTSLREAIIYANSGTTPADTDGDPLTTDVITFDPSLAGSTIQLNGTELEVTDTLTINAGALTDNVTIDANQGSRVINFSAATGDLELVGLTITGGQTTGDNVFTPGQGLETTHSGGGIRFVSSGNLTLTNSTVNGNQTTGNQAHGGGVFTDSGAVGLVNSSVSGNIAIGNGTLGGGIYTMSGDLQLTHTTVDRNSSSFRGGGIFTNAGSVSIEASQINSNTTGDDGGGLYSHSGPTTLINTVVNGNSAGNVGGGIAVDGTITLTGSAISGNSSGDDGGGISATSGTLTNTTVSDNIADSDGGGVHGGQNASLTFSNSTISGNSAQRGGGVFADDYASVRFLNSTISGNSADREGGGVSADDSAFASIHNSIVAGNAAETSGPDVFSAASGATLDVSYSLIGDNAGSTLTEAQTPDANGNLIGSVDGAGIINPQLAALADNGGPTMTHALLPGSPAIDAGDDSTTLTTDQRGAPFARNDGNGVDMGALERQTLSLVVDTNSDMSDGDFSAGQLSLREAIELANANPGADSITFDAGQFSGGLNSAIFLSSGAGSLVISDDVQIDGSSGTDVVISGDAGMDDARITSTYITDAENNTATSDNVRVFHVTGGTTQLSDLTITGGVIAGNEGDEGGALWVSAGATLDVDDAVIAGNSSLHDGGAIYNQGTVDLDGVTLTGNVAGDDGGAIENATDSSLVVRNSTLSDNRAGGNPQRTFFSGGAIRNLGTADLDNVMMTGNRADTQGGAIFNSPGGVTTLRNSMVSSNSAGRSGGAIANRGTVDLDDVTLNGNSADGNGGAIFNRDDAMLVLRNSMISSNNTGDDGGAINNQGSIDLNGVTLSGNTATNGGAILNSILNSTGQVVIRNSTIEGNSAANSGGGIESYGTAHIEQVTLSGNSAGNVGGAIRIGDGSLVLINATLSGNSAVGTGGGIYNVSTAQIYNSTLSGNFAATGGGIYTSDTGSTALQNALVLGNAVGTADAEVGGDGATTYGSDSLVGGGNSVAQQVFQNTSTVNGVLAGTLAQNGGPVETIALRDAVDNPALDVSNLLSPDRLTDATGQPRAIDVANVDNGGFVDVGAYELQNGSVAQMNLSLVVSSTDDGPIDFFDTETTLREAIAVAAQDPTTAQTITFDGAVFVGDENSLIRLTHGELPVSGQLTIDGSTGTDVTISGDANGDDVTTAGFITDVANNGNSESDNSRLFQIASGTVSLNSLTFTGGVASGAIDDGGAFLVQAGSTLNLLDSTIAGNRADGFGGAINNQGAVALEGVTVVGNVTGAGGGGINNSSGDSLTVRHSTISGNSAVGNGGGIVNYGTVTIRQTTLDGNTSDANGGGINNLGTATLSSVTISNNVGGAFGGGINNSTDDTLALTNVTLAGNQATGAGGGMTNFGTATLTNTTISGNIADSDSDGAGNGGGIYTSSSRTTDLRNSIVMGNVAGSAADDTNGPGLIGITSRSIVGNDVVDIGGIVGTTTAADVFATTLSVNGIPAGVLADNGGTAQTIALSTTLTNPALDSGDSSQLDEDTTNIDLNANGELEGVLSQDARGFDRDVDLAGAGTSATVDLGAFELQSPPVCAVAGDLDCSGQVGASDLDLVLSNWGVDSSVAGVPTGWVHDLPDGVIGADELDKVLSQWGNSAPPPAIAQTLQTPQSAHGRNKVADEERGEVKEVASVLRMFGWAC